MWHIIKQYDNVILSQWGDSDSFQVEHEHYVKTNMTYQEASKELGSLLMFDLVQQEKIIIDQHYKRS